MNKYVGAGWNADGAGGGGPASWAGPERSARRHLRQFVWLADPTGELGITTPDGAGGGAERCRSRPGQPTDCLFREQSADQLSLQGAVSPTDCLFRE